MNSMGFDHVHAYLKLFTERNPTSRYYFERDIKTMEFKCAVLVFPGMENILRYSFENVIALDMGFNSEDNGFKGQIVAVVISTAEHTLLTLAVGIVRKENTYYYGRVLDTIKSTGSIKDLLKRVLFIGDRHKSLKKAVIETFNDSYFKYDAKHIGDNVKKYTNLPVNNLYEMMYATSRQKFDEARLRFCFNNKKGFDYVRNLKPDSYCVLDLIENKVPLFGIYTSNHAEIMMSIANLINARHKVMFHVQHIHIYNYSLL